jgi:hypothetical protein
MATYMLRLDKASISDPLTPTNYDEKRDLVPHISTVPCVLVFPQVLWTTWWWPICRAETCSCSYLMLMLLFYWLNIYIYIYIYIYTICFVLLLSSLLCVNCDAVVIVPVSVRWLLVKQGYILCVSKEYGLPSSGRKHDGGSRISLLVLMFVVLSVVLPCTVQKSRSVTWNSKN